jgi:hypothetical protein
MGSRLTQYNAEVKSEPELTVEATTPLGFPVRVTSDRWRLITTMKHPVMAGREGWVRLALEQPEQVRESRSDENVLLFYRSEKPGRWTCAVVKRAAPHGFLITAYPTDAIKEGTQIWPK